MPGISGEIHVILVNEIIFSRWKVKLCPPQCLPLVGWAESEPYEYGHKSHVFTPGDIDFANNKVSGVF